MKTNSLLTNIVEQMDIAGIDANVFQEVQINISEAREVVIICRDAHFGPTQIFTQGEDGRFIPANPSEADLRETAIKDGLVKEIVTP